MERGTNHEQALQTVNVYPIMLWCMSWKFATHMSRSNAFVRAEVLLEAYGGRASIVLKGV